MRFILEFAPSKVHVLPVRISHFVALIALGYGVPLVVQDGLHLLRHCDVHRLDFPAEQLGKRQSAKEEYAPHRLRACSTIQRNTSERCRFSGISTGTR